MAATTISGDEILFYLAEEAGETKGGFLTSVTSTTSIAVTTLSTTSDTYKYALARVLGYSINTVTAQTAAAFTVTPGFTGLTSGDVGKVMTLCWWNGRKKDQAISAMNTAILLSYPYWYQETIVNAAAATLTLSASTDSYALPSGVDALIAVGVQLSASRPIRWQPPYSKEGKCWSVEGQRGAYTIRFHPRFNRYGYHEMYDTQKLCLWYATREPLLTATTGTTQLPLSYFSVAAEIYRRRQLNDANRRDLQTASVNLPQMQQIAQAELQRLGVGKRPPNLLLMEAQTDGALEQGLAMGMTPEEVAASQGGKKKNA